MPAGGVQAGTDRFDLMRRALVGEPMPVLPAAPGVVYRPLMRGEPGDE